MIKKEDQLSQDTKAQQDALASDIANLQLDKETHYTLVYMLPVWESIKKKLLPISTGKASIQNIIEAIKEFMKEYEPEIVANTEHLGNYLSHLDKQEQRVYQTEVFPFIATLILKSPELFSESFILLQQGQTKQVFLSKEQCACLLAHMVMCLTIQQNTQLLPRTFNLSVLYSRMPSTNWRLKNEKLRCIFQYFKRLSREMPSHHVNWKRFDLKENVHGSSDINSWRNCNSPLQNIYLDEKGKIEDTKKAVEADFANKFLGGGVLRHGGVQEEIQFTISPELLVGLLFCECMTKTEAILMTGAETYCNYKGYGDTFQYVSDHKDETNCVEIEGRKVRDREIIAIDALDFKKFTQHSQFSEEGILREINKAYVGFFGGQKRDQRRENKIIATGKWGCGAFRGDAQLKLLIQWIAASRAERDLVFYSFGDKKNFEEFGKILESYKNKKIGELVEDIVICSEGMTSEMSDKQVLFKRLIEKSSSKL